MSLTWLFLTAYIFSGLAGLIYEVSWTRLLALYMGHSTAATSTVVAAFMGGLAVGSALGGRVAPHLTPRQSLSVYASVECLVASIALLVPYELEALVPLLSWSYGSGSPTLFAAIRFLSALAVLTAPGVALGTTFPLAVRWLAGSTPSRTPPSRMGGHLYAANTAGGALGALAAGFVLIPGLGIRHTTWVGVAAGGLAVLCVLALARKRPDERVGPPTRANVNKTVDRRQRHENRGRERASDQGSPERPWLAALALGISGLAALTYEIVWTRALSVTVGPTTYAFSATVTVMIAATAFGAAAGSSVAGRTRQPAIPLALTLMSAAISAAWAFSLAGNYVPRLIAHQFAQSPDVFNHSLPGHTLWAAALIVPTAVCLGGAFPLALALAGGQGESIARRFGSIYAVNTLAAVGGALLAGFVAIPLFGLQQTLRLVSLLLVIGGTVVVIWSRRSVAAGVVGLVSAAAAMTAIVWSPPWDRELLASGVYKYAPFVDKSLDLESALKTGALLYYREGAASTVSVKQVLGDLSVAIDGKVDASSSGDMLTQKLLAHLPLLLHPNPREVCIIGLGSGVTLASALVHPIGRADVIEISPEIVEASQFFAEANRGALQDPRTHLILGDGRSHLLLSRRKYDVIVSEPSNPWMTGVATLFTREFFAVARSRLAPGGIICQWAHTYDISNHDLRSIVATFSSVFPNATMWLIGQSDLILVATADLEEPDVINIERGWQRPGVASDLQRVRVSEPFALWSLFVGGPQEVKRYAADVELQSDDRTALEFSGPRAVSNREGDENARELLALLSPDGRPPVISRALATAGATEWRDRGAMLFAAHDYPDAYSDYATAVTRNPTDVGTLDALVPAAVAAHREMDALEILQSSTRLHPREPGLWIATSKLQAARGLSSEAATAAREAHDITPSDPAPLEQLASIFADSGDATGLESVAEQLWQIQPDRATSCYYAAAAKFIQSQFPQALQLASRAVSLDANYAAAHNLVGAIQATLGHQDEALDHFQAALRLNPHDSATYLNLGLLQLSLNNRTAAGNYFAEALLLDPKSSAARQGLAQAR